MDAQTIVAGVAGLGALGYGISTGIGAARSLLRSQRGSPRGDGSGRRYDSSPPLSSLSPSRQVANQLRSTSVAGIFGSYIRHRDGSYTCAWHAELKPSMLDEDFYTEDRRRQIARMLASDLPAGACIQWRWRVVPDRGVALDAARRAAVGADVHREAAELCELNGAFLEGLAATNQFRRDVLSLWVRIPARLPSDKRAGIKVGLQRIGHDVRRTGGLDAAKAIFRGYGNLDGGIVKRLLEDEREAMRLAEKYFARVEALSPLKMKRFTRSEVWRALFDGHNLTSSHTPSEPRIDGTDISSYLISEDIRYKSWYVLQGNDHVIPATIVSMIKPPNETITETTLRQFATNPALTFNHTTLVEYVVIDKKRAKRKLDKLIDRTKKSSRSLKTAQEQYTPEGLRKIKELEAVRYELTKTGETLTPSRFRVVVFGEPVTNHEELKASLKELDRRRDVCIQAIQEMEGALARAEDSASLLVQYRHTLVGELDGRSIGREIEETTDTVSCLAPLEGAFKGMRSPHSVFPTVTRRLTSFDLLDPQLGSPVVTVLGTKSAGKSSIMGQIIVDFLGRKNRAHVHLCDYGMSFEPMCEVLGGIHWRFKFADPRPINVFDYPGLHEGMMPDRQQESLVVEDLLRLSGGKADDRVERDILTGVVHAVYRNEVAYNASSSDQKREPTLSHVLNMLDTFPFDTAAHEERAADLKLSLAKYRDHEWLDQPTHPGYRTPNRFHVYELKDLEAFPPDVRDSISFRSAARITQASGRVDEDGMIDIVLGIFDEVWRYAKQFPPIIDALKVVARTGRKEGFVSMLATHSQKDLKELVDVTSTAGMRIIGKLAGNFDDLIEEARLSPEAVAAVKAISNVTGVRRQYVVVCDFEDGQVVEMIENRMSPVLYWIQTNNIHERNARTSAARLVPDWTLMDAVAHCAAHYPQGLAAAGRTTLDERLLPLAA